MVRAISLSTENLKTLENILLNKHKYESEIDKRKAILKIRKENPTPEVKVNNTQSPVEAEVIKALTDSYISNRNLWLKGIEELERSLDDRCKEVYQFKYVEYPYLAWVDVGNELGYAKSTIYRIRYLILEKFNEFIGMY